MLFSAAFKISGSRLDLFRFFWNYHSIASFEQYRCLKIFAII